MEANFGGKTHHSNGPVVSNIKELGEKSMEWDLNNWKWDGDLFTATPRNSVSSNFPTRQLFTALPCISPQEKEIIKIHGLENRDLEKRGRESNGAESLNLRLGTETEIEKCEGRNGKKSKIIEPGSNRVVCQVDDCRGDLIYAKDYHRRHKVCEMHSKASIALVGNVLQRFCQQCSRFHVLEEFDEGKRSCRRRLAGHNKRRRKTHPENTVNSSLLIDEHTSNYLLVSLLRILANMHANSSEETKGHDFISHLLRNLAGLNNATEISATPENAKYLHDVATSEAPEKHSKPTVSSYEGIEKRTSAPTPFNIQVGPENVEKRIKSKGFDLNIMYDDSQDCEENMVTFNEENIVTFPGLPIHGNDSPDSTLWGNSGSLSTLSPSSSSGEAQSRTDRIVFKLFGKDPSDFPLALRKQILDWLSNSPTDIESYIRPGCIILTLYIRLGKSTWEEICGDLTSSLTKLLEASENSFWKAGWIYTRIMNQVAFMHNGRVLLDATLPLKNHINCNILSIKPIAVSLSKSVQFSVKGFNLSQSSTRLLCGLEGQYLALENCSDSEGEPNISSENIEIQCISFSCSIPNVIGRGFIEVEDQSLDSSFFPFIVAEQDVCTEICSLENIMEIAEIPYNQPIESGKIKARDDALEFMHEIGWLLHKTQLIFRLGSIEPNSGLFPFKRFKWLMHYSIEHDWCAIVKKMLDILFNGIVDSGEYPSIELAVIDMGLLHIAVRRNCTSMVKNLLKYVPEEVLFRLNDVNMKNVKNWSNFLFRPDAIGPGGLTPLHLASSKEGSENVLDALTDDPGLVGIEAWKCVRDNTGLTPNDYASLRGYYSYINIVQNKIDKISSRKGHVVLDIEKAAGLNKSTQFASFDTKKHGMKQNFQINCNLCEKKMACAKFKTSFAIYRPAMLSMLAIAAVCICAALLFKTSPKVVYVFEPFRWDRLDYGSI